MDLKFCKKCLMPDSRPRIVFDNDGVCNACLTAEEKKNINWEDREKEFISLINEYKSKDGGYDCVVPWSGGKDSSAIAHKLKFKYGLNPLLVTFSPLIPNEVGMHNREEMIQLGFDHLFFRPNQNVSKILAKRFFIERGNPKVHWDAGINSIPVQVAVQHDIKLIFYAEHGESEYGGKVLSEEHKKIRDFTEVIEHQIGDDPENWVGENINRTDLLPYIYPDIEEIEKRNIKALYFSYFFKWSMYDNYQYIKDKIDFKLAPNNRTSGTFTNFDSLDDKIDNIYYYMQFIKFGFGRCIRDASRLIQNGQLTRDEGLDYTNKYDSEFPLVYLNEAIKYLGISYDEFIHYVDKHRNSEIWENIDNQWNLKHKIY